jgi:hypothetical protein
MLSFFTKNLCRNNIRLCMNTFNRRNFVQINQNNFALSIMNFKENQVLHLNKGKFYFE